jgi:hypothetical protein
MLTDWPTERCFLSAKEASKRQSSLSGKRLMDFEGTATFEKTFRNPERKISARSSNIIEEFL